MALECYTPEFVNERIGATGEPPSEPGGGRFSCAVLWCDITGFTPLTELLVAAGPSGVEELSDHLNAYYGRLIDVVIAHGGDIIQFEGDAVLAVWRASSSPEPLADLTLRAAGCALALQDALRGFKVGTLTLSQRIAVGVGSLRLSWVGGVLARWTIVAAGDPLEQVQAIDHDCDPGQCVVSNEAWALIGARAEGRRLDRANLLLAVPDPLSPKALSRVSLSGDREAALRPFVAGAVLSRLDAAQSNWLAELRGIAVVFVQMPELSAHSPDIAERLQSITVQVQQAIYRWGGSINKLSMADKGATLLCAFGVPPLSHEDDSLRAVRAALDIVGRLQRLGVRCGVGVTTGQCVCGLVGSEQRAEYTTLGRPVNIASRLMQIADGSVVVDEATFRLSEHQIVYDVLPPRGVKGVAEELTLFRPTGDTVATRRKNTEIIGRVEELDAIAGGLQTLLRERRGGLMVLEGDAGIGKSRIVTEAIERARGLDVRVVLAEAMGIERDTPYFAWRRATRDLLGLDELATRETVRGRVRDALADDPELLALTPLLNVLLPLDLEEPPEIAEMDGEVRANNTVALLRWLLQRAIASDAVMLVVEDAHWMDSASWAALLALIHDVRPLLVLLATRPFDHPPAEFVSLLDRTDTRTITLDRLSAAETVQIICQRLEVVDLAYEVESLLIAKADGNPFFSEELAYMLRDSGQLLVSHDIAGLAPGVDAADVTLPQTVQGAIVSRVDRLSPDQQLLLKVASVIGREFLVRVLAAIYTRAEGQGQVFGMLPELVGLQLLLEEPAEDPTYLFKHALSQAAIYELMLFSQRRMLHEVVAEWLEGNTEDPEQIYPLLAHHWSRTENVEKSAEFNYRAGIQALKRYANREAARFLTRATELCRAHPGLADAGRQIEMQEGLARAWFAVGALTQAESHAKEAMRGLGMPVADSPAGQVLGLLSAVARRFWLNHVLRKRGGSDPDAAANWRRAARVGNTLTEVSLFKDVTLGTVYHMQRMLLAADLAGLSGELARAYTQLMVAMGAAPAIKLAEGAKRRAIEAIEALGAPLHTAWVYTRVGAYAIYSANWPDATRYPEEAAALTERLNDRRVREEALAVSGLALLFQGRLAEADDRMADVCELARASGNEQALAWGSLTRAECLIREGEAGEAQRLCDTVRGWVDAHGLSADKAWGLSVSALARCRAGDLPGALADAALLREGFLRRRPVAYWTKGVATAVVEVYLKAIAAGVGDPAEHQRGLKIALKAAKVFASIFPFAEANLALLRGDVAWARGDAGAAHKAWRRCVEVADARQTRLELGLGLRQLGRHLPDGPEREQAAERSRKVLEEIGATGELAGPAVSDD